MASTFDIAILGGGPAGATAGRLLAQWGYSVVIFTTPPARRPALAECLPPSTRKLFQFLGIQQAIEDAGFFRTMGNTVWWGKTRRVEPYPEGWGYQVLRGDLDRVLLQLAESAGAQVRYGKVDNVPAKFTLDCTGRIGVIGRKLRVKEEGARTVALCGSWRSENGWKLPDATHTLVEAYGDGWAWSVPLSPIVRHVAFMVDPKQGLASAYRGELLKTGAFRKIFESSELVGEPWGHDATPYYSRCYSGDRFLLVGDAGCFIDPMSSFGIKKAMVSAWVASVVVNTCIQKPAMKSAALAFFDDREREVYASYRQHSAAWFRSAAGEYERPFWLNRAELFELESRPSIDVEASRRALESIKRKRAVHLQLAEEVRIEARPGIEGREIVMRDVLLARDSPVAWDFLANVHLPRLSELAAYFTQVPDMFEAYNRANPPVPLPNFLTALAALVAHGILKSIAAR